MMDTYSGLETIDKLIRDQKYLIVCGSGGVGKTTLSAAIATRAAKAGKKTLVITVDPAKRLMNALGLKSDDNPEPTRVDSCEGELYALMINSKKIFDRFIIKKLDDESASKLLENRVYKYVSIEWAGVHEYAALQVVSEYSQDVDFLVLDTPPTKNASDFFSAPNRFLNFLDRKVAKYFFGDNKTLIAKFFAKSGEIALSLLSKSMGQNAISEILEFLSCMNPIVPQMQKFSEDLARILKAKETSFLYVTTPTWTHLAESKVFQEQLRKNEFRLSSLLVNRLWELNPEITLEKVERYLQENEDNISEIKSELGDISGLIHAEKQILSELEKVFGDIPTVKVSQQFNPDPLKIFEN